MSNIIVCFHNNCTDGVFSAFAHYLGTREHNDSFYVGVNHKPLLDLEDIDDILNQILNPVKSNHQLNNCVLEDLNLDLSKTDVYILDFCLRPEQLVKLTEVFNSVTVLDHHVSARKDVERYVGENPGLLDIDKTEDGSSTVITDKRSKLKIYFNNNKSGAVISYNYFMDNHEEIPLVFKLVQDRDLWTWELEDTKMFGIGIRAEGLMDKGAGTFNYLTKVMEDKAVYDEVIRIGNIIDKPKQELIETVLRLNVIEKKFVMINRDTNEETEWKVALLNNSDPTIISEACNELVLRGYDLAVNYSLFKDGNVKLSLRSAKHIDSTLVSVTYGGGGHEQASGCDLPLEMFHSLLLSDRWVIQHK